MRDEAAPGRAGAVLRWGFAATVVLSLAVAGISITQVQRARQEVRDLAREADRTTFLVGEVGRHITQLRAAALDRILIPKDAAQLDEDFAAVASALDDALANLEPLLAPEEQKRWSRFLPLLAHYRRHVDGALAFVAEGHVERAQTVLLEQVNPLALQLQGKLDELVWLNEDESAHLLAAADGRLATVALSETVLGGVLLVGLVAIWWSVMVVLARQQCALGEYVGRIEASNRDLDAFAGRIAHDLRNAISPVGFAAAALRQAAGRPDAIARVARQLDGTVQRTRGLLDGLLAFSRAGQGPLPAGSARVTPAVENALEETAALAARVDAAVETRLCDAEVACAPGLLHLVAANLIGNALKFLDHRPLRRVRITSRVVDATWCELAVDDTGPGIPRASVPHIFEPFYRVPETGVHGTGIGLATVDRIVRGHGGTIQVESELGSGTMVVVRLPLAYRPPAGESDSRIA
ncbi:MAG TPA: ATP-binding protein [Candidatus Binatia bacterium]|nr:ATP-binding protein [Candidatus Binatia bacterium]